MKKIEEIRKKIDEIIKDLQKIIPDHALEYREYYVPRDNSRSARIVIHMCGGGFDYAEIKAIMKLADKYKLEPSMEFHDNEIQMTFYYDYEWEKKEK